MKSETALVGTEGRVELDAVATVDLEAASVILPDDAELDHALGNRHDLEGDSVLGLLLEQGAVLESRGKLCRGNKSQPQSKGRSIPTSIAGTQLTIIGLLELGLVGEVRHGKGW